MSAFCVVDICDTDAPSPVYLAGDNVDAETEDAETDDGQLLGESPASSNARAKTGLSSIPRLVQNPFVGTADIDQYLLESKRRFSDHRLWEASRAPQFRGLQDKNNFSAEVTTILDEAVSLMQKDMANKVMQVRTQMFNIGKTAQEILQFTLQENAIPLQECHRHFDQAVEQIKSEFKLQKEALSQVSLEYHKDMMHHNCCRAQCDTSRVFRKTLSGGMLAIAGILAFLLVLGCLRPSWMQSWSVATVAYTPVAGRHGSMWYSSSTQFETWFFNKMIFLMVLAASCARYLHWSAFCSEEEFRKSTTLVETFASLILFVQQNESMWEGMLISLDSLQRDILELRMFTSRRTQRVQDTAESTRRNIVAVTMTVDEYIVWLNERDFFPMNMSIQSMLQPDRYDRIKSTLGKLKRSARSKVARQF